MLGQSNLFFAALVVAAIGALQVDADRVAGALLGAAVCIKPYALLFAPWLVVNSQRDNRRASPVSRGGCRSSGGRLSAVRRR